MVSTGEMEDMSITSLPWDRPSATPPSPNSTWPTSGVSGTMTMMISAACATALLLGQRVTPACCSASGVWPRVLTNSLWPAAARCPAMGVPMMPRPMKPMLRDCLLMVSSLFMA